MGTLLILLCGLALILFANLPDLLGGGHTGIGMTQLTLSIFGLILCVVSFMFKIGPFSWIKVTFQKHDVGKKELWLFGVALILTLFVFDISLNFLMPPRHQATELGWSVEPNHETQWTVQDSPGHFRTVTNKYFEHGFKRWPRLDKGNQSIFIIGDSMTQMNWVSNHEEWYSFLENEFPATDFFVFGAGGYGSLQEYLILDKYYDEINPNYILWQFCGNDYPNNFFELDFQSYPYNNLMVRPYLEDEEIVFRLPMPLSSLRNSSFFADRMLSIYDIIIKKIHNLNKTKKLNKNNRAKNGSSNNEEGEMTNLQRKAFEVTQHIMTKVRKKVNQTPVYLVNLCGPLSKKEKLICESQNFRCVEGIHSHILEIEEEGEPVRVVDDGHYNKKGNQIIGEWLVQYFTREGVFR